MRPRGKWMGPEDVSRIGKGKVPELYGPDGGRRSIVMTSGAVSSEYGESQVSARRTGVTSPNVQWAGANLGPGGEEMAKKCMMMDIYRGSETSQWL
jgi:hypothetical protein